MNNLQKYKKPIIYFKLLIKILSQPNKHFEKKTPSHIHICNFLLNLKMARKKIQSNNESDIRCKYISTDLYNILHVSHIKEKKDLIKFIAIEPLACVASRLV